MKTYIQLLALPLLLLVFFSCMESKKEFNMATSSNIVQDTTLSLKNTSLVKVKMSNEAWKKKLTANQYYILREQGTERAFSNEYYDNHDKGHYFCAGCKLPLFSSDTKFESGTGWPSFFQPLEKNRVTTRIDNSHGMIRGEVVCARCEGHLGHVFDDGPKPTGLRYCMNSGAMLFQKSK
uniref:peptide-methionine (R)-S-oxide reductase MsrB n=1 Tax=Flavobacterium sp. TaxID=239 RepID=UPI00404A1973